MDSTQASSSNPSKKIKLTIIPPIQLFVNISSDKDVTTTPSPITTSYSPSIPNVPSKTPSTNDASSTFRITSSLFEPKPQSSPLTFNDTPSSQPSNPFLKNVMDAPPRPSHPLPLQSHPSLDITLSLSPITPLDYTLNTPSPPSPQPQPQSPLMCHPIYFNYHDYHGSTCLVSFTLSIEFTLSASPLKTRIDHDLEISRKTIKETKVFISYESLQHLIYERQRGVKDEEVVVGEGVVVISSLLYMLTNSCLGGIMMSLIFLEGLDEEALVKFMVEEEVEWRPLLVPRSFLDDELSEKELKQIEADDQAIQTILLGLPEDIYAAVDSCETAQEIQL
nr:hypothetical protein [Tanacetum cinerariifolium]